jgi:hypothetical protein
MILDATASAVYAYGGHARRLDIRSHHDLVSSLEAYALARGLPPPDAELTSAAAHLYDTVTETRNKVFIHPESWREYLGGFSIGERGASLSLLEVKREQSRAATELTVLHVLRVAAWP